MILTLSLIASCALLHRLCRYMLSVVLSLEHRRLVDLRGVLLERFGDAPGLWAHSEFDRILCSASSPVPLYALGSAVARTSPSC